MTTAGVDVPRSAVAAPEWELLLCFASRRSSPERLCRARAIAADRIDWDLLVDLADRHRVAPLVRAHLRELERALVPAAARAELDRRVMLSTGRSLVLVSELGQIATALADRGVRALAYKGPVVSAAAYGSPILRPMRDLDVLIHPRDFRAVEGVLLARGYRRVTGVLWPPLQRLLEYQCCFARERDGALVELHWTLMPRDVCAAIGLDDLWERRREVEIAGHAIPCLAAEDRLLSLCVHGAKHRWARLEWITCIAELIQADPPDWDVLLRRARDWRVERMLRLSLLVARELLQAPVMDEVLRWARADAEALALALHSLERLPGGPSGSDDDDAALKHFHLRAQDRARGRMRYRALSPMIQAWRAAAQLSTLLSTAAP